MEISGTRTVAPGQEGLPWPPGLSVPQSFTEYLGQAGLVLAAMTFCTSPYTSQTCVPSLRNQSPSQFLEVTHWSRGLRFGSVKLSCPRPHRGPKPGLQSLCNAFLYYQLICATVTMTHNSFQHSVPKCGPQTTCTSIRRWA